MDTPQKRENKRISNDIQAALDSIELSAKELNDKIEQITSSKETFDQDVYAILKVIFDTKTDIATVAKMQRRQVDIIAMMGEDIDVRLEKVKTLIEESSASHQVNSARRVITGWAQFILVVATAGTVIAKMFGWL